MNFCKIENCANTASCKELCALHYQKSYRIENAEKIRLQRRAAYQQNIEARRRANRAYARENKEAARRRYQTWKLKNPGKEALNSKLWRTKNKEPLREYRKKWLRRKPENHLIARLRSMIRTRLVRLQKDTFAAGSFRHLPYTAEQLRKHLESLFKPGMSWDNTRMWHIDHVVPLKAKLLDGSYFWQQEALADVTSTTFQKAWALENLQPLWAEENCSKQNKYLGAQYV